MKRANKTKHNKQIEELRKEISERDARRDARQVPTADPMGYTE